MVAPDGGFQQRIAAAWNCPADVADVVAWLAAFIGFHITALLI